MNTEQSYVGRGTNATTPAQTVISDLNSPPTPDHQLLDEARVYQAQSRLLDLVDKFSARGNYAPMQAANDLLHYWLVTPPAQLAAEGDKDQFHAVLLLIDSLSEVYPIDSLPTITPAGERAEPLRLFDRYALRLAPDFLNRLDLAEHEEDRAGLMLVADESMAPQLRAGSEVIVVAYDPDEYATATGVVIACPDVTPRRYILGRVAQNEGGTMLLVRDNPDFAEEQLLLSELRYLGHQSLSMTEAHYVSIQPSVVDKDTRRIKSASSQQPQTFQLRKTA